MPFYRPNNIKSARPATGQLVFEGIVADRKMKQQMINQIKEYGQLWMYPEK